MKTGFVLAVVTLQLLSTAGATRLFEARLPPYGSSFARQDGNNGIHLAVSPVCGPLSGNVSDVNAGVRLSRIKTIVAFGVRLREYCHHGAACGADYCDLSQDSYTDGGRQDGGPLPPPVITPPDAEAGGRSTDGKVWVEDIADDIGATIMDYAVRVSLGRMSLELVFIPA